MCLWLVDGFLLCVLLPSYSLQVVLESIVWLGDCFKRVLKHNKIGGVMHEDPLYWKCFWWWIHIWKLKVFLIMWMPSNISCWHELKGSIPCVRDSHLSIMAAKLEKTANFFFFSLLFFCLQIFNKKMKFHLSFFYIKIHIRIVEVFWNKTKFVRIHKKWFFFFEIFIEF